MIESIPIDTKQGGNVGFYLVFGDGSNGGENADPDEDVVLEYSNDDGQTWTRINTYDTEDYTSWTWINEAVPAAAMTPSTSFRLRQVAFDNTTGTTGSDNWGIDQFTITGAALLPRSVISDDFNYGTIDTDDWADIKGGSARNGFTSGAHSLFFGSSSDGGGQRLAEALPVDVRGGGRIQFDLVFGTGSNGGDNAEDGDDVVLEYSTNGGSTWTLLNTYDTEAYTAWTRITETIPTVAQSANTSFRLRQVQFDASSGATGADNWGLDNFSIVADPLPAIGDVDLVVEAVTLSNTNGIFGGTTDVSWTVRNQGSDASDSQWSDRLYLSTDDILSEDDIFLATVSGPRTAIAAGAAYTQAASVTLPDQATLGDGNYHVLVQADTTVSQTETDESNNVGSGAIDLRNQWANFSGAELELQIFSPNLNNPITDPVQVTVSDAVEVTTESFTVFSGYYIVEHSFDISADSIFYEVSSTSSSGIFPDNDFNGYVITDVADALPDFTNVTIDPINNTLGLQSSDVTFTANEIFIDVASLSYSPGLTFELDIDFATVAPLSNSFIQPDTAVASSEYSSNYRATYTIDGSGIADPLGPTAVHSHYCYDNHWTSASGTAPQEQYIEWGFNSPQTLDAIHLWNHQSTVGPATNDGYDVTLFDLTLFDAADNILLNLDDVAMRPDLATAQTFSFGQTVANVSRVRFDIEDVQSSPSYTGLAEVGFNAV